MSQEPAVVSGMDTSTPHINTENGSESRPSTQQGTSACQNGQIQETTSDKQPPVPVSPSNDSVKSMESKEIKKEATILPTNTKGLHTVFIHKLYNMLEDDELKHLIWWTQSNESFVIVPGEEFSRALSQYFKHTNVASFVRQLNMYGFHKVSDVTNPSDSSEVTTWEFRHSSGSFRKGDIDSLKQIKRRSSKHTSMRTTHLDPGLLSDAEVSSERSNSVTEYPQDQAVADPMLNVRLSELGHNLAALRHEHARLQLRYDTAISDMRKTNMDMVYLLDIMQKLIHSNTTESETLASPKPRQIITQQSDDMASPGSSAKPQHPQQETQQSYTLQDVESDISRFRASIIQRAATKEQFDQFSVPFAPSYQMDQIPRSNQFPPQHMPMQSGNQSPADTSLMAGDGTRYSTSYPYPYPPQNIPYQHPGHTQQMPVGYQIHPGTPQEQQIVHDPFRSDRKSSRSSNRSRNMSILCDPLQPSAQATTVSPASSHLHRGSINGPDRNSYFPDYRQYQGVSRIHTPEPPQVTYKMSPVPPQGMRDQRSGSFPGIAPGVQNSLRGEGLMRKRHNSNDGELRAMENPPRSIPDEGFGQPQMPRKSLSATNITDSRSLMEPKVVVPNSGVYALLNPADRRDSVSVSTQPQPKKTRNQ